MSKKTVLISVLSVILLAALTIGGITLYNRLNARLIPGLHAVPNSVAALIEINQPAGTWKKISAGNDFWQELTNIESLKKLHDEINIIHDLLNESGSVRSALNDSKIYLSIHDSGSLIIGEFPHRISAETFERLFRKFYGKQSIILSETFKNKQLIKVNAGGERIFNFTAFDGLFISTFSMPLFESAIDQINSQTHLSDDPAFNKVRNTAGKNVDANIYFYFPKTASVFGRVSDSVYLKNMRFLNAFAGWAELDLLIKNDELLLNGYTTFAVDTDNYLRLLNTDPGDIEITSNFPFNTSFFIYQQLNNYTAYYPDYLGFVKPSGIPPLIIEHRKKAVRRTGLEPEQYFLSWIGDEVALLITDPGEFSFKNNLFAVIKSKDKKAALKSLTSLAGSDNKYKYRNYPIYRINFPYLLAAVFGDIYSGISENYVTLVGEYVVFGNSMANLKNYINAFESGKVFSDNENYVGFSDNISDRANLYLYCNIRKSLGVLSHLSGSKISEFILSNQDILKNYEGFGGQFSFVNNMFYTNFYLKYNPAYKKENASIWSASLDTTIIGKPYLIRDHRSGKLKIIAFDALHNMYMIDEKGSIKWKIGLAGPPVGDIHQIDFYDNGKIQYLFNTTDYLYLIDLLGRKVEGFPVKLPVQATNSLSVFDYNNEKDYRLLIAGKDRKIYNLDKTGKKIRGWNLLSVDTLVRKPVQHLFSDGKDYIITTDVNGKVYITDRRGRTRIKPVEPVRLAENSRCYINRTNSKGVILSTDTNGVLTYISKSGKINKTLFDDFSADHYFLYEDFNNDGHHDFIYLDKNNLRVYNRFTETLLSYQFDEVIDKSPVSVDIGDGRRYIGIVSSSSGDLLLFNKNGMLRHQQNLVGETLFSVGSLNNDGRLNLVTGSENKIFNYLID